MKRESNSKKEVESTTTTTAEEVKPTKTPSAKQVVAVTPPDKTEIAGRLDKAVKAARPVNRSSDLVPLNHDFDTMRRELKALISTAKKYQHAMIHLDKARMDIALRYSVLASKSPIFLPIGNTIDGDSVATVAQAASKVAHDYAKSYEDSVVNYCIEWERLVSTRVDTELKETKKLNERLNHYQHKVMGLRARADAMDEKGKESPTKMTEKLTRNEKKLDQAWRAHERSASMLCNLLEEITVRGWKDLYPLVMASIQWEVKRASGEYDIVSKLPAVVEDLVEAFEKGSSASIQNVSRVPIAMANDDMDSATTGSLHDEVSLDEAPATPKRNLSSKVKDDALSPKAVEHI